MSAEFGVVYEVLEFVGVFVVGCALGVVAAIIFASVEGCCRPKASGRLPWYKGLLWSLVLVALFAATGAVVAACAVYNFPIAAGVIIVFFVTFAVLWLMVYGTSAEFRRGATPEAPEAAVGAAPVPPAKKSRIKSLLTVGARRPIPYFICLFISICWALTCVWLWGMCFSAFPNQITTWISRQSQQKTEDRCSFDAGRPCHVYFTLSDGNDFWIVNFHNRLFEESTKLVPRARWYYEDGSGGNSTVAGYVHVSYDLPYNSTAHYRAVSWAYVGPLETGRSIVVAVSLGEDAWSKPYRLRTFPSSQQGLRIVAGGDTGDEDLLKLYSVAASHEPHFAMHGGDVAYGNGMFNCVWRWDVWLYRWETHVVTPQGYSVPLTLAVGNHESGGFGTAPSNCVYFRPFFAQQPNLVNTVDRLTYHEHRVTPNLTVFVIDSNVVASYDEQKPWLAARMAAAGTARKKWGVYHVPLYPSISSLTSHQSGLARKELELVFFEHGLQLGFEHHDHGLKRSFPVYNKTVNVTGAPVYVGDGCWGVSCLEPRKDEDGIFAFTGRSHHIIFGEQSAGEGGWNFRMVGPENNTLHTFQIP